MTVLPGLSSDDPYFLLRGELQDSVHDLQQRMSRFHGLMPHNPERKAIAGQVEAGCESIRWQLDELNGAVDKALVDPARFNLTGEELSTRRRWIESTRKQVDGIQKELATALAQPLPPLPSTSAGASGSSVREANGAFMASEHHQQRMIIKEQDRSLDDIEMAVSRIGHMGKAMAEEMQEQERLLNDLNEDMDSTQVKLKATQKRILDLIRDSSKNTQLCIIIWLSVVLVILIVFAFG